MKEGPTLFTASWDCAQVSLSYAEHKYERKWSWATIETTGYRQGEGHADQVTREDWCNCDYLPFIWLVSRWRGLTLVFTSVTHQSRWRFRCREFRPYGWVVACWSEGIMVVGLNARRINEISSRCWMAAYVSTWYHPLGFCYEITWMLTYHHKLENHTLTAVSSAGMPVDNGCKLSPISSWALDLLSCI